MDILKIYDVFQLQLAKFIFNCIHLNVPSIFHNWFKLNYTIHNYNTRSTFSDIDNALNSNNIFIINARTTHYGLKLIKVSGLKIWNCIPKKIRDSQSVNSFKLLLKKHLISQYTSPVCSHITYYYYYYYYYHYYYYYYYLFDFMKILYKHFNHLLWNHSNKKKELTDISIYEIWITIDIIQ